MPKLARNKDGRHWPNFEVGAPKLVNNPKLYMLLGVYGEKYKKKPLKAQKEVYDKRAPRVYKWVSSDVNMYRRP